MDVGTRLGPYEILAPLGAGGMAEVYKARDTRLDRTVAIKILPTSLAADVAFRERFEREARAVSRLDHPHICALYDVGQQDGIAFLVMQYLDGETLAARLEQGPLPIDQAIACAAPIADALSRAHRAGVIHRDVKPGNVMLTKSGPRLLDFGLAKAIPPGSGPGVANLPTTPAALTAQGTILGTFQYMAPEQVEGLEADIRSDIWAFGCVLYEMISGTRPFTGRSPASLLANILNAEPPPLATLQPLTPPVVEHIVRRCLEKDPDARWQSMTDVGHELRWAETVQPAAAAARPRWRQPLVYAGAALLAAAAWLGLDPLRGPAAAPVPEARAFKLRLHPPDDVSITPFVSNGAPHYALSPDGQHIAFVASKAGRPAALWVQRLDSRTAQEVPGSQDAAAPFWSSDSQSLAFFAEGRLKTIGRQGERPSVLGTIVGAAGGAWHGDVILVGRSYGPVFRLSALGGPAKPATTLRPEDSGHRWPQFLPDGRHFIYTESRGSVNVAALDAPEPRELFDRTGTAVYAEPGFLFYAQRGRLMAQPFDPTSQSTSGSASVAMEQVDYARGSGYPPVSVARDGLMAYWDGATVSTSLKWIDRRGKPLPVLPVPPEAIAFAIAPDGHRIAFTRRTDAGAAPAIWLMDESGTTSKFSFTSGGTGMPFWSSDGRHVLFTSAEGGELLLMRRETGGASSEEVIGKIPASTPTTVGNALTSHHVTSWSRDGRVVLISDTQQATGRDVVALSIETGAKTMIFERAAYEIQARLSPDDRWIAYASNETGRWEVFVEPYPVTGTRAAQVSIDGGSQPVWRRDGKELYFLAPDGRLMAVSVSPGDTFRYGPPEALFLSGMRPTYAPYPVSYDVTADGQRFLVDAVQPGTAPTIGIVLNWPRLIRR